MRIDNDSLSVSFRAAETLLLRSPLVVISVLGRHATGNPFFAVSQLRQLAVTQDGLADS